MINIPVIAKRANVKKGKMIFLLDADLLESLVGLCGFFSKPCEESIKRAEEDIKKGRVRKIKSLQDLEK